MKSSFAVLLSLLSYCLLGQTGFAIINDKDGFCNVRNSATIGNNVADTLHNGHLVYCSETKGNWINIMYSKKKDNLLNGQVYSDRLKPVSDYTLLSQLSNTANQIILGKDSMKVVVTQQEFDKAKYKFSYYKESKTQIEFINNKQYWGSDGGIPTREYKSIEVYYGKRKIALPQVATDNLLEPSLYHTEVNYDTQNDVLYIQSSNSDGAGAYGVIWKIEKGVYKERFIAYGF